MILSAAPTPHAVAAELEALAARTGDKSYARAARVLLQATSPGREPIDDALALVEAAEIVKRNPAMSLWSVLMLVARRLGPIGHERSTAQRLRRKWKVIEKNAQKHFCAFPRELPIEPVVTNEVFACSPD